MELRNYQFDFDPWKNLNLWILETNVLIQKNWQTNLQYLKKFMWNCRTLVCAISRNFFYKNNEIINLLILLKQKFREIAQMMEFEYVIQIKSKLKPEVVETGNGVSETTKLTEPKEEEQLPKTVLANETSF